MIGGSKSYQTHTFTLSCFHNVVVSKSLAFGRVPRLTSDNGHWNYDALVIATYRCKERETEGYGEIKKERQKDMGR